MKNYKNILLRLYMSQQKLVYQKQEISADIRAALNYSGVIIYQCYCQKKHFGIFNASQPTQ